jgi:hypothetical protein
MTKGDYDVGYGKPPAHARFRKGQSGNPKGRGKGAKNFPSAFLAAMMKPVTIVENGKRRRVTKLDAAAIQLANNAARGDKNSIQFAVALMQALEPPVQAEQDTRTVIILPSNGREQE